MEVEGAADGPGTEVEMEEVGGEVMGWNDSAYSSAVGVAQFMLLMYESCEDEDEDEDDPSSLLPD